MKFIHCADLHLDQPFQGLGKTPAILRENMVSSNQKMFETIVDTAISQQVDFVLIVGDTFHQPIPTVKTQNHFILQLKRLADKNIQVVLTFGNHDYYQQDKYWFPFPDNTVFFTTEEVATIHLTTNSGQRVALSGFSYESNEINAAKSLEFPTRDNRSNYHIGLYHGQMGHVGDHSYAPFQLTQLKNLNYDYWALGHIHQPTILAQQPPIIYPGSPIGHTKKEQASRGFILAETFSGQIETTWQTIENVLWLSLDINLHQIKSITEIIPLVERVVQEQVQLTADMSFLQLTFSNYDQQMSESLVQEIENEEILGYLQQQLFSSTEHKLWLYELKLQQASFDKMTWPLGITSNDVETSFNGLQEKESFQQELHAIFRQPELRQLFSESDSFKSETLKKVSQQLGMTWLEEGVTNDEN